MIDVGLITSAVLAAAEHLGVKAADSAASTLGGKVVDWLRQKLTSASDKVALEKLAENPNSPGARRTLEGVLLSRLETEPALVSSLASLLKDAVGATTLTQNISGNGNIGVQSVGKHTVNTIVSAKPR